jgi:hypothetical protein
MVERYVVVPGIPVLKGAVRRDGRYYAETASSGFDLYDNKEKCRLFLALPSRHEAKLACQKKNGEQLFDWEK